MKNIKLIIAFFGLVGLLFTSCEKVLEVYPTLEISDETALNTGQGLQTAVIGAYDRLQSGYLYGGRIWVGGDMLADNVKKSGDYALVYEEIQFIEKSLSPDNLITASFWSDAYFTINIVNRVLQAMPDVTDLQPEERDIIEGECLFIRSMLYFDMTRYWGNPTNGLGVPLILEPTSIDAQPARAQSDVIMQQVINDLQRAADLLPEKNNNRATSWAAKALMCRVYFYNEDYENSALMATEVIDNGPFALVDSVQYNYQDETLTDEMIFVMVSTQLDASCGTLNGYFRKASTPRFSPSNKLLELFRFTGGEQDQRYTKLFAVIDGKSYTTKFDSRYMHVPLIRLAEMYITRSECRFRADDEAGALEDLNVIRERAGLDPETNVTLTFITRERTKELFFEGDDFHNQRRLKKDKISNLELPWNNSRFLYKIPQRELDVNDNLVQN